MARKFSSTTGREALPTDNFANGGQKLRRMLSPLWLESEWDDTTWVVGREFSLRWDITLPDGTRLTQPVNSDLLETARLLVAQIRENPYAPTASPKVQYEFFARLLTVLQWMNEIGVSRFVDLRHSDVARFFERLKGGSSRVVDYLALLRRRCAEIAAAKEPIPETGAGRISIRAIAEDIGIRSTAKLYTIPGAMRELEYLSEVTGKDLSHLTGLDRGSGERSVSEGFARGFFNVFFYSWELKADLPDALGFDPSTAFYPNLFKARDGRTRTLENEFALQLLERSMIWVGTCARPLLALRDEMGTLPSNYFRRRRLRQFSFPASSGVTLKITSLMNQQPSGCCSLYAALYHYLWSACLIILGTFTAARAGELLRGLDSAALEEDENGDFWLKMRVTKFSGSAEGTLERKPIPEIAAEAVRILTELSRPVRDASGERRITATPSGITGASYARKRRYETSFDLYTEMLGMTSYGPLRSHQLRRFFVIAYFWHYDFRDLRALSFHMRHSNLEMLMRYVTEAVGGDAVSEEQRRLTVEISRKAAIGQAAGGFARSFRKASGRLGVSNLQVLSPERLHRWVENYVQHQRISLRPSLWGYCAWSPKRARRAKCSVDGQAVDGPVPQNKSETTCIRCANFVSDAGFAEHFRVQAELHEKVLQRDSCPEVLRAAAVEGARLNRLMFSQLSEVSGEDSP